jgi:predicted HicB family RNase H-like nuclease
MTTKRTITRKMRAEEEHAYYEEPESQVPTGPPVRRRRRLSEPVPVRFPEALLAHVRERAAADDRSLSSWIRRAVEHELAKETEETNRG